MYPGIGMRVYVTEYVVPCVHSGEVFIRQLRHPLLSPVSINFISIVGYRRWQKYSVRVGLKTRDLITLDCPTAVIAVTFWVGVQYIVYPNPSDRLTPSGCTRTKRCKRSGRYAPPTTPPTAP